MENEDVSKPLTDTIYNHTVGVKMHNFGRRVNVVQGADHYTLKNLI